MINCGLPRNMHRGPFRTHCCTDLKRGCSSDKWSISVIGILALEAQCILKRCDNDSLALLQLRKRRPASSAGEQCTLWPPQFHICCDISTIKGQLNLILFVRQLWSWIEKETQYKNVKHKNIRIQKHQKHARLINRLVIIWIIDDKHTGLDWRLKFENTCMS